MKWHDVLGMEKEKSYFQEILIRVASERAAGKIIYPAKKYVFNAFRLTEIKTIKAVIIGQDPYHGINQAHGLAFSASIYTKTIPPSLVNIYKELVRDIPNFQTPNHGCLEHWAHQGVLLLNSILTVEEGHAHSHATFGWEIFTDHVIAMINKYCQGIVFLLWGSHAQKKASIIDHHRHYILKAPHPSPLSAHRGFFGCRHFSKTNELLIKQKKLPIDWNLNIL